jgi:proteic killer suppression protein
MIRSWRKQSLERFYRTGQPPRRAGWAQLARLALRKLDMLDAAERLEDLRIPPANRLEALKGDRAGQYSIRIKSQWRVCLVWRDGGAQEVEIVDYH